MRILITGINGFLGRTVGEWALAAGHSVLGIDLSSQTPPGWRGDYLAADVADRDLAEVMDGYRPDTVIHGAGSASVGASYDAPAADLRAALFTWSSILDAVRRAQCSPLLIYPSSAAVYGNPDLLPVPETAAIQPISPYGYHKAMCELLAAEYCQCFGLDIVVARLFSIYGPRQRRLLVWELFERAAGDEPEVTLHGSGKESRDYLYADDLAQTLLGLAERRPTGHTVVNVASGEETRIADLARIVVDEMGGNKSVRPLGQAQTGNPVNWRADVTRLGTLVTPSQRTLAEGIAQCVAAWR